MSDSAVKILSYSIDLDRTIGTTHLDTLFATGEKNAHRFELTLHHGGVPVTLPASATAAGSFVHCGSRETVDIAGSIEDGKVIVTLKEACYLNSGKFTLAIDVEYGNVCATVFYGEGGIARSRTDNEASTPSTSDPILQSKSVTPSETAQTVRPDSGYDGLSSVSVGAISKTYVGSSVSRKAAATITPGTSDQSIAAGQYLSGKQTIKGDADLIPGNIRSGVNIFGVTGTYAASGSGTSDPVLQQKTYTPTASGGSVRPDDGYDGLSAVYITGDADLVASNIKSGVNIFGVTGTYTGSGGTGGGPYTAAQLIEWTPESDTTTMEVAHTLGVVPDGYRVLATGAYTDYQPSGSEKYVLNLESDIAFEYISYYVATGAAATSAGAEGILYIITDLSSDVTAQRIKASLGSWTFKGGQTYEILVYKR